MIARFAESSYNSVVMEEEFQPEKTVRLSHVPASVEGAVPDKAELHKLSTDYKAVQLNRINKEEELARGAQSISISESKDDPEANVRRTRLIEYGRKLDKEIQGLKVLEAKFADALRARGEDPSTYAVVLN